MHEVIVFTLLGMMRMLLGALLLDSWDKLIKEKFIVLSFLMSFVYSTLFVVLIRILFTPLLLGVGLIVGFLGFSEIPYLIVLLLMAAFFLVQFWIELKNNLVCLLNPYPIKHIIKITVVTHLLSLTGFGIYVLL